MTCRIAQKRRIIACGNRDLLNDEATHAVRMLLPEYVNGDLSSLCLWPDQVRNWYKYRWTSSLHFIDTPDKACNFDFDRVCHDQHGVKDVYCWCKSELYHSTPSLPRGNFRSPIPCMLALQVILEEILLICAGLGINQTCTM